MALVLLQYVFHHASKAIFCTASVVVHLLTTAIVNLPIGGASFALIVVFFSNPAHVKPITAPLKEKLLHLDLPGVATLLAAAVCFFLALQWGGSIKPWSSGSVIATLVMSGVLIIGFIFIEIYSPDHAGLPHKLLKVKTIRFQLAAQALIFGAFFCLLYYLPIYFQVVSGVDPAGSGVRSIPLIGGASIFAIAAGVIIMLTGEFQPLMIVGHSLTCIACGLIYTLQKGSSPGHWAGYEIIGGIGLGLSAQLAVIVCQQVVEPSDLATASGLALFFQFMGGAVFLTVAQALFQNKLVHSLAKNVPGVSPNDVISAGATGLRSVLSQQQLDGGVQSYLEGLRDAYILSIVLSGMGVVVGVACLFFDRRKLDRGMPKTGSA